MRVTMILRRTMIYLCLSYLTLASANMFSFARLRSYAKYLDWDTLGTNSSGNELWNGIIDDCSRKMSFSCIQKNAYTYLDNTFVERDNITVFEGFVLRRNDLDYETMTITKKPRDGNDVAENLVEDQEHRDVPDGPEARIEDEDEMEDAEAQYHEEHKTPLEEITSALREKTVKFLATRDYELQLPDFFFEGSTIKISPREIDDKGALIRVDFGQRELATEGRLFKKIKKFIRNKLLMSFLALILIIKLIKVKFMFIIPFLFGIGTAKKLFLKLLLFLVPAFAHVFKLCSSYYTSNSNRLHHHHHQIAHHHHHVPVPVPVPAYFDPHDHLPHHEDVHETYDYAHPHIQLRKDIEALREWGIAPLDEPYDDHGFRPAQDPTPLSPVYQPNSYVVPQQSSRPPGPYQNKFPVVSPSHAQSLAYNGYIDDQTKHNRRIHQTPGVVSNVVPGVVPGDSINIQIPHSSSVNVEKLNLPTSASTTHTKTSYAVYSQPQKVNVPQVARPIQQVPNQIIQSQSQVTAKTSSSIAASSAHQSNNQAVLYDDTFYGPILERLEDIFAQLRFVDENCRERLICSMYKNPALYSPHSNHVSNELSRDPQELTRAGGTGSSSSQRFHRYVSAARLGQDGGDCLRTYHCQINTE